MHRCLEILEILGLVFEHVNETGGGKTLASLARTCRLFSSPALDVLWRDLDCFMPLFNLFPVAPHHKDDPHWLTLRKYAMRVKAFRGQVPRYESIYYIRHWPEPYLPLLPNVIEINWHQEASSVFRNPGVSMLRYFAGCKLATLTLSTIPQATLSKADLRLLADLPKLCPNVTSFAVVPYHLWDTPPAEIGGMVDQWLRLRTVRTCAMERPLMDRLFCRKTLASLYIDYYTTSPINTSRIPATVYQLSIYTFSLGSCTRILETMYASPTTFYLSFAMDYRKEDVTVEPFHLLPLHLDTSRLLSLTLQPVATTGMVMFSSSLPSPLGLGEQLVSALIQFTALRELDLDALCTANMPDADFERLAGSLPQLRSLKLGTNTLFRQRRTPVASLGAVVGVLKSCESLEKLHISFDATILPLVSSTMQDGKGALPGECAELGWSVSNRRITKLTVGHSPIEDATINAVATCLKSILPCLVRISFRRTKWRDVQNLLGSN